MKCQFLGKWSNKLEGNIVADILFIAINFLKYPAIKAPLFFILKKFRACLVKKINNFSTLYTIVLLFFPSIFKCYSFIEYIDSIEYIVYLINTQRCRVPLYFTSDHATLLYRLFQIRALLILNGFLRPKQHIFHTLCIIFMTSSSLIQINTGPNP